MICKRSVRDRVSLFCVFVPPRCSVARLGGTAIVPLPRAVKWMRQKGGNLCQWKTRERIGPPRPTLSRDDRQVTGSFL